MKTKRKTKPRRFLAALLGIVIVLCLLTGLSTVTGNPLVSAIVKSQIISYLATQYPNHTFVVQEMKKSHPGDFEYIATVMAENSIDTHFHITASLLDGIQNDDYDYWVTSMRNTRDRLGLALAAQAQAALQNIDIGTITACESEYGYDPTAPDPFPDIPYKDSLTLDMPFEPDNITIPTLLRITVEIPKPSQTAMDDLLVKLKSALEAQQCHFDYYTVTLIPPNFSYDLADMQNTFQATDIPVENI